jgi:hypothetical protein
MIYSLHIGINKYDPKEYGDDADLTQCVRDAYALADIARTKFSANNARILADTSCTLGNLKHELTKFAHLMNANDVLLYTHSGHGTYHDFDGKRATGVCAYDGVLWDFELIPFWRAFRAGTRIVRLIDTCYSESNFRTAQPLGKPRFIQMPKAPVIRPTADRMESVRCSIVSVSSSSIKQPSYENDKGGVFTLALEELFKQEAVPTYAELHKFATAQIKAWNFSQSPKLEAHNAGQYKAKKFLT